MSQFLGIDAGSSYLKAALIDPDRPALGRTARVPFPEFLPGLPPLHREVDPAAILQAVADLLQTLAGGERFDGLVLCGQMHGFILVDERGAAVSNYISWLDQRVTAEDFEQLATVVSEEERRELGNEFRPSIAMPMLWWLGRHSKLPPGRITPVSIADFIAARLCETTPVMEPTQAAAFGALRLGTLRWHDEVIGKAELDSLCWPVVRPAGSVVGHWQGAPCYAAAGDAQCALAGALLAERELSINIGTGSQVAMLAATASDKLQTRPYFDDRLLRTITHIPAGRALGALVGLLTEVSGTTEEAAWRHIEQEVSKVAATDLRAGISFFPGACGDRGFLENLHEGNLSAGHVFRAVFESMAENYRSCAERLDADGVAERIVFSGGVARRLDLLRDLTAARLALPARLSPHPEDTLLGLLVLALAYSGRARSIAAATAAVAASL